MAKLTQNLWQTIDMQHSKVTYNPRLSLKENARRNSCTVANIKWYIKTHEIDHQYDRAVRLVQQLRDAYQDGMSAYKLSKISGRSINTVKKYWGVITGDEELSKKYSNRQHNLTLRQNYDFYATHPSVVRDLLREETFGHYILEPASGLGHLSKEITALGYECLATDLIDRGESTVKGGVDFFTENFEVGKYDIITNPPFNLFIPFITKSLSIAREKVALLLPMRYLSSKSRYEIYKTAPPKYILVYIEDILLARNGEFEKYHTGNRETYAWYVWEKGFLGEPTIRWIHNLI